MSDFFDSTYNGKIEVKKAGGGFVVLVGGYIQSGAYMERLWGESFGNLFEGTVMNKVLILGFCAGSVVEPLRSFWPKAKVVGVEIDHVMVKIGRKYFSKHFDGVKIIINDARDYIEKIPKKITYDLVIVDCYIGGVEPENLKTKDFLLGLKKIAKCVLVNQVFLAGDAREMKKIEFLKEIDAVYPAKILKRENNLMIGF